MWDCRCSRNGAGGAHGKRSQMISGRWKGDSHKIGAVGPIANLSAGYEPAPQQRANVQTPRAAPCAASTRQRMALPHACILVFMRKLIPIAVALSLAAAQDTRHAVTIATVAAD